MTDTFWYIFNSAYEREEGPFNDGELKAKVASGEVTKDTLVYSDAMANWEPAGKRPEFHALFGAHRAHEPTPPPRPAPRKPTIAHEIDYEIFGDDMQYVEITLDPGEACVAEAGAFMYMDPGIQMHTIFGDGSGQEGGGFMGKLMAAGKRVLTGESLFSVIVVARVGGGGLRKLAAPKNGSWTKSLRDSLSGLN